MKDKKIDALINNVGVAGPTGTMDKLKTKDWVQTLKINVISHFIFSKLAILAFPCLSTTSQLELLQTT